MTNIPENFYGRRAALGGLAGAFVIFGILFVTPLVGIFVAQHDEINESLHQLALYRAEAAQQSQLETNLKSLRQRGAAVPGYIVADNIALAEAAVQGDVKTVVEANGGQIHSAQIGETKHLGNLDLVAIQYDLTVPITHLRALIYDIETHTPYYFIDHADISAPMSWQPSRQAGNSVEPEPQLEARWTIKSYRWSAK